jgi:hypothetical protein
MLKLKTKTEFTAPGNMDMVTTTIRLIIDSQCTDRNNVVPKGYFYYPDENGVLITKPINFLTEWADITNITTLENGVSLLDLRAIVDLKLEAGNFFGTTVTDWEVDND